MRGATLPAGRRRAAEGLAGPAGQPGRFVCFLSSRRHVCCGPPFRLSQRARPRAAELASVSRVSRGARDQRPAFRSDLRLFYARSRAGIRLASAGTAVCAIGSCFVVPSLLLAWASGPRHGFAEALRAMIQLMFAVGWQREAGLWRVFGALRRSRGYTARTANVLAHCFAVLGYAGRAPSKGSGLEEKRRLHHFRAPTRLERMCDAGVFFVSLWLGGRPVAQWRRS